MRPAPLDRGGHIRFGLPGKRIRMQHGHFRQRAHEFLRFRPNLPQPGALLGAQWHQVTSEQQSNRKEYADSHDGPPCLRCRVIYTRQQATEWIEEIKPNLRSYCNPDMMRQLDKISRNVPPFSNKSSPIAQVQRIRTRKVNGCSPFSWGSVTLTRWPRSRRVPTRRMPARERSRLRSVNCRPSSSCTVTGWM